MVYVSNYEFKPLTDKKVTPEEYFINFYVDKFLESEGTISSAPIIRISLDAKYEKAELNQVMAKQCQYLSPD